MDRYSEVVEGIKDTCDMLYSGNYIDIYYGFDSDFYVVYVVTPDTVLTAGFNKDIAPWEDDNLLTIYNNELNKKFCNNLYIKKILNCKI